MSKLFAVLMIAILIALPACGGDDDDDDGGDVGSVEDVETCEQLADLTIDEMQVLLNEISDMTLEDMQNMQGDEAPEPVRNFTEKGEEFQAKADEIGCDDAEYQTLIEDRVDQLEADGPVAELILEALESGSLFEGIE